MLRHDYVTGNNKPVTAPHALQSIFEKLHGFDCGQVGTATVTAERDEMKVPGLLVTAPECATLVIWKAFRGP
jgi:hypothetical protein